MKVAPFSANTWAQSGSWVTPWHIIGIDNVIARMAAGAVDQGVGKIGAGVEHIFRESCGSCNRPPGHCWPKSARPGRLMSCRLPSKLWRSSSAVQGVCRGDRVWLDQRVDIRSGQALLQLIPDGIWRHPPGNRSRLPGHCEGQPPPGARVGARVSAQVGSQEMVDIGSRLHQPPDRQVRDGERSGFEGNLPG